MLLTPWAQAATTWISSLVMIALFLSYNIPEECASISAVRVPYMYIFHVRALCPCTLAIRPTARFRGTMPVFLVITGPRSFILLQVTEKVIYCFVPVAETTLYVGFAPAQCTTRGIQLLMAGVERICAFPCPPPSICVYACTDTVSVIARVSQAEKLDSQQRKPLKTLATPTSEPVCNRGSPGSLNVDYVVNISPRLISRCHL